MPNTRSLTLAEDIMSSNLIVIHPKETLRKAVELMTQYRLTGLLVVDRRGKLLGMLNEKDILNDCDSLDDPSPGFLDRGIHYRKSVKTVMTTTPIDQIRTILAGKSFRHIPVINADGELRGIITRRDLIRILYLRAEISQDEAGGKSSERGARVGV